MTAPRIAMCVPTRQRAPHLGKSLASLLTQTFTNFSLVVVDSGSTDATRDVVSGFDDPRLRYVRYETDLGMTANWNRALALALDDHSAYVALFHDDDSYAPDILEREAAFLDAHAGVGLVHTAMHYLTLETGRTTARIPYPADRVMTGVELMDDLCLRGIYHITTPTVLARREAYEKAGWFDPHFTICPDLDLWWRMLDDVQLGYIATPLFTQTIHVAQTSSSPRALEMSVTQHEPMEAALRAVRRIHLRTPEFDGGRHEALVRRFYAGQILLNGRVALAGGHHAVASTACRNATRLSASPDIHAKALLLQLANNAAGRAALAAATAAYRRVRNSR